jgi:hypothetical protein
MRPWICLWLAGCSTRELAVDEPVAETAPLAETDLPEEPPEPPAEDTGELPPVETDTTPVICDPVHDGTTTVVITDIDETMTTSDSEWLTQVALPFHDPEMRPRANDLMVAWQERGYRVMYITARGDDLFLLDGRNAREATIDWLAAHRFPFRPDDVFLADGVGALFDADGYKAGVLRGLQRQGYEVVWAYGNADTDILAYKEAGIPNDHQFLVGDLAGTMGVNGVPGGAAYRRHMNWWPANAPCGR